MHRKYTGIQVNHKQSYSKCLLHALNSIVIIAIMIRPFDWELAPWVLEATVPDRDMFETLKLHFTFKSLYLILLIFGHKTSTYNTLNYILYYKEAFRRTYYKEEHQESIHPHLQD